MLELRNVSKRFAGIARERQLRDTIFQERYQAISKKYMKELRAQALIEIR